jgi:hypothetical protein
VRPLGTATFTIGVDGRCARLPPEEPRSRLYAYRGADGVLRLRRELEPQDPPSTTRQVLGLF